MRSRVWQIFMNRCSSAPVSWVRWKNCVTTGSVRSSHGSNLTSVVTCPARNTRSCRNRGILIYYKRYIYIRSVTPPTVTIICFAESLSKLSNATCANTCNFAPGPGGSCGRRSSPFSTSPVSRMRWRWVSINIIIKMIEHSDPLSTYLVRVIHGSVNRNSRAHLSVMRHHITCGHFWNPRPPPLLRVFSMHDAISAGAARCPLENSSRVQ